MHTTTSPIVTLARNVLRNPAMSGLLFLLAFVALAPTAAHAQSATSISVPFISEFGCSIVQYLKGPLAILIFILVCVGTLVIGMITKMDWARIITVCVIFGIVISIGAILGNSSYIQNVAGMSSCLQ
jgi:type IV secretory pathway VirB2 component (pilin)